MDRKLFKTVWEKLLETRPDVLELYDVFEDRSDEKGLTIGLIDNIKLTIWEDGTINISDFSD